MIARMLESRYLLIYPIRPPKVVVEMLNVYRTDVDFKQ